MTHRHLLLIVVFAAIFSFDLARATDMDFWWHVRTGQLIAETGVVPTTDPFSYTATDRPWVVHEWLWDLGAFQLTSVGGYRLAVVVSATLVLLAYIILYRLLRRLGANEIVSAVLVLWAAVLALPNLGVRPREVTHLFLAVYLHRLLLYRAGLVRQLWVLPVVMLLWVNVHGAFVLGLGVLGLVTVGETIRWRWQGGPSPRHLWVVLGTTLAAVAVNPRGPWMLLYPFKYYLAADNPSFRIVTEFASPNFHEPMMLLFAAGLIGCVLLGLPAAKGGVSGALLAVAFVAQALGSTRQVSVCAMVLAPLLAQRLVEEFAWARERPVPRLPWRFVALNWAVLVFLVGAAAVALTARPEWRAKLQLDEKPLVGEMPEAGVRFIEANDLPGQVFNAQEWGGYLIYRWYPSRRVFIDGRVDMYGTEVVNDYLKVVTVKEDWREVLDRNAVRTVLTGRDSALSVLLLANGGWQRVFQGEVEDVFVRP